MGTITLDEEQLEILKNILKRDIEMQEKQLEEIGNDIRFEMWLVDTKIMLDKVEKELRKLKEG